MSEVKTTDNSVCENIAHSGLSNLIQIILNAFLHVSILFTFLTFLFTFLVAPITKDAFKNELDHIIVDAVNTAFPTKIDLSKDIITNRSQKEAALRKFISIYNEYNKISDANSIDTDTINNILDNVDTIYSIINNDNNSKILDNYIKQYENPNYVINLHNNDILSYGRNISLLFLTISIILIISIKIACPDCLNVTKLFVENILTFSFIGIVEYWFFTNFALKFVPAPPSLLYKSAVDAIKANVKTD